MGRRRLASEGELLSRAARARDVALEPAWSSISRTCGRFRLRPQWCTGVGDHPVEDSMICSAEARPRTFFHSWVVSLPIRKIFECSSGRGADSRASQRGRDSFGTG